MQKKIAPVGSAELAALLPPRLTISKHSPSGLVWQEKRVLRLLIHSVNLQSLVMGEGRRWRFNLPTTGLESQALMDIDWE
ncbi:hypothetical protein P4909_23695 [Escherichia coli]